MKALLFILGMSISITFSQAQETRTQIALVDTGIKLDSHIAPYLCEEQLSKDFTTREVPDFTGRHGTAMAKLIAQSIDFKTHCIFMAKWNDNTSYLKAVKYAIHSTAKYINISAGGAWPLYEEFALLRYGLKKGQIISVAAGNDGVNLNYLCYLFPACFSYPHPNFHVVGALNDAGTPASFSNYGAKVTDWELGVDVWTGDIFISGTSPATAILTGKLAGNLIKHKKSTLLPALYIIIAGLFFPALLVIERSIHYYLTANSKSSQLKTRIKNNIPRI